MVHLSIFQQGSITLWSIWKARNKLIFDHKQTSAEAIITNAMEMAKDYILESVNPNLTIDSQSKTLGNIATPSWKSPPTNSFNINVDGLVGNQCVAAALIPDHKNVFIQGETQELHSCDPKEAKARAFLLGL